MPFSFPNVLDTCESLANWTAGASVTLTINNVIPVRQGLNCLHIEFTATGQRDFALDNGSTINIRDNVLVWPFYYVSGKGDQFLQANANSIQIRGYSVAAGARGNVWAEWDLKGDVPDGDGHNSLNASWNRFFISGDTPSRVGAGGAPNYAAMRTWEFRFDVLATNGSPGWNADPLWFGLDAVRYGDRIVVTGGTDVSPLDMNALFDWSNGDVSDIPNNPIYDLVRKRDVDVSNIVGLQISDGVTPTYFRDRNIIYSLDQYGDTLDIGIRVLDEGRFRAGLKSVGAQDTYAIEGWTLFAPETNRDGTSGQSVSSYLVEGGASYVNVSELYGTKLFRMNDIRWGSAGGAPGTVENIKCDFANPNNMEFRAPGSWKDCDIHDSPNPDFVAKMHVAPALTDNLKIFNNPKGMLFEGSFTGASKPKRLSFTDHGVDIGIRDPNNVDVRSTKFTPGSIERVV